MNWQDKIPLPSDKEYNKFLKNIEKMKEIEKLEIETKIVNDYKKDYLPFYLETFKEITNCHSPLELYQVLNFIKNEIGTDLIQIEQNLSKKGIKLPL